MNVSHILHDLQSQRAMIDDAIAAFERLTEAKRPVGRPRGSGAPHHSLTGRPPGRPRKVVVEEQPAPEDRFIRSAAARKRMSIAQKRRWRLLRRAA
jgi:hypothetical protein